MEFLEQNLANYIVAHTSESAILLQELERETNLKVLMPRMISGHFQGRVLSMLSKMIRPKNILEIGTMGSTFWIMNKLSSGKKVSIDIENREVNQIAIEVGEEALKQFGQQEGQLRLLNKAPEKRKEIWRKDGLLVCRHEKTRRQEIPRAKCLPA